MLNDYDKKYVWLFVAAEIVAFLAGKLIKMAIGFIPAEAGSGLETAIDILSRFVIPGVLLLAALIVLNIYRKNRESSGSE